MTPEEYWSTWLPVLYKLAAITVVPILIGQLTTIILLFCIWKRL